MNNWRCFIVTFGSIWAGDIYIWLAYLRHSRLLYFYTETTASEEIERDKACLNKKVMRIEVNINAEMITWAITRAGHDLHEFLIKEPKIKDWIEYKKKPTVKQLEKFSNKVHIPFGYLFLANPPKENLPIPFFRTEENKPISLNVYDAILILQRRQEWLREYLAENEYEPLEFVGKYNTLSNVLDIVKDIRKTLNLGEEWAQEFPTWEKALQFLTKRIEENRIIISFNSVVGHNTRRPIKVEDCRGFVLVDSYAPFMFVNSADSKAAQMFTIVHELAHIWTGESAGFDFRQLQAARVPAEQLCDKVAAEFLVPERTFSIEWTNTPDIKELSRLFKVSPIVIARRALDLEKMTKREFFTFYNSYINKFWLKKNRGGGGNFYNTAKKRISFAFASHINHAVKTNKLLYRDASRLTGLKGETYRSFVTKTFDWNEYLCCR